MIILYLFIAVLFILLITLIAKLIERKTLFTSFITFSVVLIVLVGGFTLDSIGQRNSVNAIEQIKTWFQSPIAKTNTFIQETFDHSNITVKDSALVDAPIIKQMPELPRGCEVTSLAMLLQHAGVQVDKMTLAEQIKKEPSTYRKENGVIYFGHPNDGFVGDMYSYHNPGLGVYHKPINNLAEQYLPGQIVDFTGADFHEVKVHLSDNRPVWVIINTAYSRLPDSRFQTWQTPSGPVKITYKEHSVLVTGYDKQYVYFNDPLTGEKNKKAPITEFEDSWVQMGKQAITYLY
ncbi:C39 family peptidase [Bacillus tuaregi]|uniref:C39 family peptidase n=1 Tax=Bacillus tuaregi TaxID=1816695 RepID=UPI0008F8D789|nr:C39 family peptidase [Bacillus tuaregi]